jgi:hypothetical protein
MKLPYPEYVTEVGRMKQRRRWKRKRECSDNQRVHLSNSGKNTRFKIGQFVREKSPMWKGGPLAKYGLHHDAYDKILEIQNGKCAICEKEPKKSRLQVDHDHDNGNVRGLLCFRCNYGIGWFQNDIERLKRLFEYLKSGRDYRADFGSL